MSGKKHANRTWILSHERKGHFRVTTASDLLTGIRIEVNFKVRRNISYRRNGVDRGVNSRQTHSAQSSAFTRYSRQKLTLVALLLTDEIHEKPRSFLRDPLSESTSRQSCHGGERARNISKASQFEMRYLKFAIESWIFYRLFF